MDCNPLSALLAQMLLSTLIIAFTSKTSLIRLAALPLIAICTGLVIQNGMRYMIRAPWAAGIGGYSISFFLQYLDVALLSRYVFQEVGTGKGEVTRSSSNLRVVTSFMKRTRWAFSILINFRFINTPQSLKNPPKFSTRNPDYIPTRLRFLLNSFLTIALSYLFLDLLTSLSNPDITATYLSMANIPFFARLSELSGTEILMRVPAVVCLGISMNCVQGGIYSIMAFFSVLCGFSQPQSWPPFYGPLLEARSLRKFWGMYWHQINTRKFLSLSKFVFVEIYVLDMRKSSVRYLRLVMIFLFSGIMHLLIDIASGIPLTESGALKFFSVQIFGILLEDNAGKMFAAFRGADYKRGILERIVGYVWVLSFLTWSVPAYLFPMLSRAGPEHSTVPYSVLNKVLYGGW